MKRPGVRIPLPPPSAKWFATALRKINCVSRLRCANLPFTKVAVVDRPPRLYRSARTATYAPFSPGHRNHFLNDRIMAWLSKLLPSSLLTETCDSRSRFHRSSQSRITGTSLHTVEITEHSTSSVPIRSLASERNGNVIKCVFSVTAKELEDPNLSFCFILPAANHGLAPHYLCSSTEKFPGNRNRL